MLRDMHSRSIIIGKEINMENMHDMCKQIADKYGYPSQSSQLMEECAELIQAINKYKRAKTADEQHVALQHYAEEIADVEIMLDQIKYLLDIKEDDLNDIKQYKLHRTLNRV